LKRGHATAAQYVPIPEDKPIWKGFPWPRKKIPSPAVFAKQQMRNGIDGMTRFELVNEIGRRYGREGK